MEEFPDDYDVEVVDKVCDDFFCMICTKLMYNAIEMKCGHSLCCGCLKRLLQSFRERRVRALCPQCRCSIAEDQVRPAMTVRRLILSLKVKCKNIDQGCTWQDQLDNLKDHLEKNCSFSNVECPFNECSTILWRRDMVNHTKMCEYRIIQCQYCNAQIAFKNEQLHHSECFMYPVPCILNCGVIYTRQEHLAHLDVCPLQEIECPYKSVGCDIKIIRNQNDAHLKTSSEKHMLLLLADLNSCKAKLTATVVTLNTTVEKLIVTEEKLSATETKLDTTETTLKRTNTKLLLTKEKLESLKRRCLGP